MLEPRKSIGHSTVNTDFINNLYVSLTQRKENIGDFLSALTFDLSYELHQPSVCSLCPVLDAFTGNSYRAEVRIKAFARKICSKLFLKRTILFMM